MKRVICAVFLAATFGGAVYAAYPAGFGIGVVGSSSFGMVTGGNAALSLKFPRVPLYWGVALAFSSKDYGVENYFSMALTVDYAWLGAKWTPKLPFGWFIRLGGFGRFTMWGDDSVGGTGGVRLPIGVNVVFLRSLFEIFLDVAPSIGLGTDVYGHYGSFYFPDWSIPIEFGLRLWL